ncbi:MAG TPA: hypothetical protein VGF56_01930, partial [Rhizomicrobium sp.]
MDCGAEGCAATEAETRSTAEAARNCKRIMYCKLHYADAGEYRGGGGRIQVRLKKTKARIVVTHAGSIRFPSLYSAGLVRLSTSRRARFNLCGLGLDAPSP